MILPSLSESGTDAQPNIDGIICINPGDVHRKVSWVSGAIVYQIFVERFFVGR